MSYFVYYIMNVFVKKNNLDLKLLCIYFNKFLLVYQINENDRNTVGNLPSSPPSWIDPGYAQAYNIVYVYDITFNLKKFIASFLYESVYNV